MRGEDIGEDEGNERCQPHDGEPLALGGGDALLDVAERYGDAHVAVRERAGRREGQGGIDEVRIERVAVADAEAEAFLFCDHDLHAIRMVVKIVQTEQAGTGFGKHGPGVADEGDPDAEGPAHASEERPQSLRAPVRNAFHLHTDELCLTPRAAHGFIYALFLDAVADIEPRQHQRHDDDGEEAQEEAGSERDVVHVTPCSGSPRRARFR